VAHFGNESARVAQQILKLKLLPAAHALLERIREATRASHVQVLASRLRLAEARVLVAEGRGPHARDIVPAPLGGQVIGVGLKQVDLLLRHI